MATLNTTFKQVLRGDRLTSLATLARAAGVSRPLLSQILSGKQRVSTRVARLVAKALGQWARRYARDEARLRLALKRHARKARRA